MLQSLLASLCLAYMVALVRYVVVLANAGVVVVRVRAAAQVEGSRRCCCCCCRCCCASSLALCRGKLAEFDAQKLKAYLGHGRVETGSSEPLCCSEFCGGYPQASAAWGFFTHQTQTSPSQQPRKQENKAGAQVCRDECRQMHTHCMQRPLERLRCGCGCVMRFHSARSEQASMVQLCSAPIAANAYPWKRECAAGGCKRHLRIFQQELHCSSESQ